MFKFVAIFILAVGARTAVAECEESARSAAPLGECGTTLQNGDGTWCVACPVDEKVEVNFGESVTCSCIGGSGESCTVTLDGEPSTYEAFVASTN
jgi:hypothetical protein